MKDYKEYLQNYINSNSDPTPSSSPNAAKQPAANLKDESNKNNNKKNGGSVGSPKTHDEKMKAFFNTVFQHIIDYSPKGKTKKIYNKEKCLLDGDVGSRPENYKDWYKLSYKNLGNCLEVSDTEFTNLKTSHASFTENLNKLVLPKGTYKGDGIVLVGGGKFSLLSYLVIKTIRNLGTTLPIEVFIPPNEVEGESEFCSQTISDLDAKCIYISDILPKDMVSKFEFKGYQFKSLAIIASSFENLLLLDADNTPIKNLNTIFKQEPYASRGLVLWPDFWRRTTQPIYYKIAGIPVNLQKRVRNDIDDLTPVGVYTKPDMVDIPFHDFEGTMPDVSTESGQLMVNKSKHLATVLLALYYNVNGPNWYYPIFSQKAAGEGDKETFIAGANFYDLPYYQVKSKVGVDGYHRKEGFRGVAMLQHDFVQDYNRYKLASADIAREYSNPSSVVFDKSYTVQKFYDKYFDNTDEDIDVMFIHSNLPKFDPLPLWKDNDLIEDGKPVRSYTNLRKLGYHDIEYENFKTLKELLCEKNVDFKYLADEFKSNPQARMSFCKYITDRYKYLEETHQEALSASE